MKPSDSFEEFIELISVLRKECPWDRKQTHESIRNNLIEEAYEAVDAIDEKNMDELSRELGDLLLHIVFQSQIASETESFTIRDVIYNISEKLIRRHPHVFANSEVKNDRQVATNWETIKLKEGKDSVLDGLPKHLPELIKAQRMQEKAANVGFDWAEWQLAWEKLNEEIDEWRVSVKEQSETEQAEEFGDLLFSLINVGRLLNINANDALKQASKKFEQRFKFIESRLRDHGKKITESNLQEMDSYWNEAKKNGL
ncbi:MAG: nucleoside triphosphate pyrophosphohydrolase [Balneolaceae bacterium]|nr:MAG: nucleoside triphosphate pyrophosphohydrolase [Balneolaceae bacterium]